MKALNSDPPVVATVIVTFNRKSLLRDCLRANLEQTHRPDYLVLIDNASSDGTTEMLEEEGWLRQQGLVYYRLDSNEGGAGGFTAGIAHAMELGADRIWLMDDDAIPEADALEQLLRHATGEREMALLASQVTTPDGLQDIAHRVRVRHFPFRTRHIPATEYAGVLFAADAVSFVGPLLHRKHVEVCGLPRAEYFLYSDDFEFTHRVRRAGFALYVVPASRILHLDEGRSLRKSTGETGWEWRMYYRLRNRVHWYRDVEPRFWAVCPWLAVLFMLHCGFIVLRQPAKGRRLRLLGRAFGDGWHGRLGKTIDPASYRKGA